MSRDDFETDDEIVLSDLKKGWKAKAFNPPKWSRNFQITEPEQFKGIHYGPSEIIESLPSNDPKDLFSALLTDEIVEHIVFQTNLFAQQSEKFYLPTNSAEIKVFIGINFLMGIKPQASYRDYWSSRPELNDAYISKLMSVKRFSWILGNIHLNDSSLMPNRDSPNFSRLYKVQPLLDMLLERYQKCFDPGELLAVDESMIKFKGRSSLKQYLPKKPIKRGYKVWMLCDKSGYICNFEIYTGKKGNDIQKNLGESVVLHLSSPFIGNNHKLYFDNFFTTCNLMVELKRNGIYACGTVQANRKFLPSDLKEDRKLSRGEFDWKTSDSGLLYLKWKDKRSVTMLSNFNDPEKVTKVARKKPDGTSELVPCPEVIAEYNSNMNNVDKFDQLKKYYEVDRKSHKWWHRIFFHFLDVCVVNAYILAKFVDYKQPLKEFKLDIINYLTTIPLPQKRKSKLENVQIKKKQALC